RGATRARARRADASSGRASRFAILVARASARYSPGGAIADRRQRADWRGQGSILSANFADGRGRRRIWAQQSFLQHDELASGGVGLWRDGQPADFHGWRFARE